MDIGTCNLKNIKYLLIFYDMMIYSFVIKLFFDTSKTNIMYEINLFVSITESCKFT